FSLHMPLKARKGHTQDRTPVHCKAPQVGLEPPECRHRPNPLRHRASPNRKCRATNRRLRSLKLGPFSPSHQYR
uniref:Uncharacterized protein n=1 Tax=Scleropages formosus TaxID=113540 RepID=A0A8C9SAA2_SCLFO